MNNKRDDDNAFNSNRAIDGASEIDTSTIDWSVLEKQYTESWVTPVSSFLQSSSQ